MIDELDLRLLELLTASPRAGVLTLARQLRVARGTVQARLDKLVARGVVTGFGPDIDLEALGYTVHAFVTLEIAQGRTGDVTDHLRAIPEVIEVHMVTGVGDLLCRLAARTNEHLGAVLAHVLEVPGISRTTTVLSLSTLVPRRVLPVVAKAARPETQETQTTVRATAT